MPTRSKSWVQARRALAIVSALVIVPVILATGSRAGLILGLIGVCAALVIFFIPEPQRRLSGTVHIRRDKPDHPWRKLAMIAVPLALIAAGYFALSGNHDNAASRMAETSDEEMRTDIWGMSLPLVSKYFPLGSGAGSFVETVKIDEPIAVIKANYVNHAHNDILEVAVTTGLAGLALMLIAASFLFRHGRRAWRDAPYHPDIWLARLASIFALIFIGASVVDYPLRVPSLMAFATVFAFWIKPKLAKNNPDGADR